MSAIRRVQQWATFARIWHVYDAAWQNPFESAQVIRKHLTGEYKPIYHPLNDCGDNVIVINSSEIALPGQEWEKRVYFHHTGYPGGATWTKAWELHKKDPNLVLKKAVYRCLNKNLQRHQHMARLHIFSDSNVPESLMENVSNQIRQVRPIPKRLDHYSQKEIEEFPKLIDLPKDYVLK